MAVKQSVKQTGQVSGSAAEVYEEFFVPALFREWAEPVAAAAGFREGQRVLDVACGTGVLARAALQRVGDRGSVVGLDINEGMLSVARRTAPLVEWKLGRAEEIPYESETFGAVGSQFGLMFFDDRMAALREMYRVLRPGGKMAVVVWDSLERTAGFARLVDLLQRLFGDEVADTLRAPFAMGDPQGLLDLFAQAGLENASVARRVGKASFPSVHSWMWTNVRGWTLSDQLDDAQFNRLLEEAEVVFKDFITADGRVEFASPAYLVSVEKGG